MNRILLLREAGAVRRVHTIPGHHHYTVAQHVYGMLALLDVLWPGDPPATLVRAILYHDVPERWLGDMPGSAKAIDGHIKDKVNEVEEVIRERFGFELPKLTFVEKQWLKALDRLEFWMWCMDEYHLGNMNIEPVLDDMENELRNLPMPPECSRFFYEFVRWERSKDY